LPVYRPRTRLVNFRLSEDEYQLLKQTCARSGARSVSDYARSAVLSGSGEVSPLISVGGSPCADRWDRLEGMIQKLESKMTQSMSLEANAVHG
jgi:hypothetical protein